MTDQPAQFDVETIRDKSPIEDVIGGYVELKKDGNEFKACCPFHGEKTPSFHVVPNKGFYHCFGCGAHGDVFDFVMEHERVDFKGACEILGGERRAGDAKPKKRASKKLDIDIYAGITPIVVNGNHEHFKPGERTPLLFNPKRADDPNKKQVTYTPSMVFPYRNETNAILGYVLRVDIDANTKITPTLQYCELPDGSKQWTHRPFIEPRSLYGLEQLVKHPGKSVIICEGEKAKDAAYRLIGGNYVCISWNGGTHGRHKADWSPLKDRRVLMWPDMDEPGMDAAIGCVRNEEWKKGVCEYALDAGAAEVEYIKLDESKEKGWDAADAETEGLSKKQIYNWIKQQKTRFEKTAQTAAERKPSKGEKAKKKAASNDSGTKIAPDAARGAGDKPPKNKKEWYGWLGELRRTEKDVIKGWAYNIVLILTNDDTWAGKLGYCDFSYRIIKHDKILPDMRAGEWEDADTARLKDWLASKYWFNPSRAEIIDALIVVAQKKRFHPVRDYLNALEWQGESLLASLFIDVFDSPGDVDYLALAARKFLIGAVARVMQPGCKNDNVLILEGNQGIRKSTFVRVLFGEWFNDSPIPLGEKDAYQTIQGIWGQELAELDSFNKAESTTAKNFFSQCKDRYRPSYGHMAQDFPRQCVFVGTTNQDEYLKDYSGNRRYWPVYCRHVNIDAVKLNRDQLWAEALHLYRANEVWWPEDADRALFEHEQDNRLQLDPWHYPVERFLRQLVLPPNESWVTADQVLDGIGKDTGHSQRADQNRLAPIMKALEWHKTRKLISTKPKIQKHVYERPEGWKTEPIPVTEDDQKPF